MTLHRLCEVPSNQKKYDAAIESLRQALTLRSKMLGTHADVARTTFVLAKTYQEAGKYSEAGRFWRGYIGT